MRYKEEDTAESCDISTRCRRSLGGSGGCCCDNFRCNVCINMASRGSAPSLAARLLNTELVKEVHDEFLLSAELNVVSGH